MIIDFAFSNIDHTCPGWRECGELKDVWRKLELERLSGMPGTVRRVAGITSGLFVIYILLVSCPFVYASCRGDGVVDVLKTSPLWWMCLARGGIDACKMH
jgi:hypothetical protein